MSAKKIPFEQNSWDDLRVFLEVARQGGLSRAARRLGLDHSTVSRRISQLEFSLDAKLFDRESGGLRLTKVGESLIQPVQAMEIQLLTFAGGHMIEGAKVLPTRIAMMEGIGSLYFARHADWLARHFPSLPIELVTSSQVVHINKREADLFLSFFRPSFTGATCEALCRFSLGLFASQGYLDAKGMPRGVEDLACHDFVTYVDDLIQVDAVRWLEEVIPQPQRSFTSSSMIAQMAAAGAGVGIVLLPLFSLDAHSPLIRILPEVQVVRELWLSVDQDIATVPRVQTAIAAIKGLLSAHPL
jgi:DNA-binding transcriptional LysR family regulator